MEPLPEADAFLAPPLFLAAGAFLGAAFSSPPLSPPPCPRHLCPRHLPWRFPVPPQVAGAFFLAGARLAGSVFFTGVAWSWSWASPWCSCSKFSCG